MDRQAGQTPEEETETETKQRKRERVLRVCEGGMERLFPSLLVQPQTWSPSLQTEPKRKRKGGLTSRPPIPHPLSHMECWPQAPFLQDVLLPKSQLPYQLRGLLAWFWKLPWTQGSAKQLGQGV